MMRYLFLLLSIVLMSCGDKPIKATILQGEGFGTTYTIQYYTNSEFEAEKGVDSVINALNKSVSTYLPKSDISRINQGDSTVVTDEIFKQVYRISETVYEQSNGLFDPTVGILRNAYGFGDVAPITEIDSTVLDSLRKFVGFEKVKLNANGTISKRYPEIYFDFNAVAKGYGIDQIGAYLEHNGVSNYIIELGGEVLAKGMNLEKDKYWTAGIEAIDSELTNRSFIATVQLKNQGLASSGNYRKFRINPRTGKKYVHTINPLTGLAQETNVTSATIIASSCGVADAYATACMAMGFDGAKKMIEKIEDIEGYLTYVAENGENKVYKSSAFQKSIELSKLATDGD